MITDQRTFFPDPAIMVRSNQCLGGAGEQKGTRLPWIHNKDSIELDFHSVDISPSKNHVAVP
jgi:hypothetical protein